jgi:hypothetical protein
MHWFFWNPDTSLMKCEKLAFVDFAPLNLNFEPFNSLSLQTAVVPLADEELHLVAVTCRRNLTNHACFWGYKLSFGL